MDATYTPTCRHFSGDNHTRRAAGHTLLTSPIRFIREEVLLVSTGLAARQINAIR